MHKCINYKLETSLNNPYIPIEEEIIGMLDAIDDASDNDPLKKWTMCKLVMWW